jgi:MFS family permease
MPEQQPASRPLTKEAFRAHVEAHHGHNFVMMVAEGALFIGAMVLYSGATVLSGFMTRLGASSQLIGLTLGAFVSIWTGVQLYAAFRQGHLSRKRRPIVLLRFAAGLIWIAFASMLLLFYQDTPDWRTFTIWMLVGVIILFSFLCGYSVPLWMDFVGKIFRENSRGRYYGWRNGLGALIGLAVSVGLLAPLLKYLAFPYGYAWALLIAGIFVSTGAVFLSFSREASPPERRGPASFKDFVGGLFSTWRLSREFRYFVITVILTSFGGVGIGGCMCTPFFMNRAIFELQVSDYFVGIATAVLIMGQVLAGIFCGRLVDRLSAKLVFFLNLIASTLVLILAAWMPGTWAWSYLLIFLLMGVARGTTSISFHNCIMEMVPVNKRPEGVGLVNFIRSPFFMLAPFLGGVLLHQFGFPTLFIIGFIFSIATILVFLFGVGLKRIPLPEG